MTDQDIVNIETSDVNMYWLTVTHDCNQPLALECHENSYLRPQTRKLAIDGVSMSNSI